jgi:hypothetical protein
MAGRSNIQQERDLEIAATFHPLDADSPAALYLRVFVIHFSYGTGYW